MENKDFEKVIAHVNRIIDNLNQHWHSISLLLSHVSKPLLVDDRGLSNVLKELKYEMHKQIEDLKSIDIGQAFAEIKYIGKRLNEIELTLAQMAEKGITKNIDLNFTVDGYHMVKKPVGYDPQDPIEPSQDEELKALLNTLLLRESQAIIHRFGLFGQKKKTYDQLGEVFGVTRERARQIFSKAIRKLRSPVRKKLMDKVTHSGLRKAVFGE